MEKKNRMLFLVAAVVFICSTAFFLKTDPASALRSAWIDEKKLGEICIGQVTRVTDAGEGELSAEKNAGKDTAGRDDAGSGDKSSEEKNDTDGSKKSGDENIVVTGDPLVIIYHTHSTESYMPYSESNYHREEEEGTVRDVGNVLETELKKKGINVIHDRTLHDRPSYNESYSRSLETVQALAGLWHPARLELLANRRTAMGLVMETAPTVSRSCSTRSSATVSTAAKLPSCVPAKACCQTISSRAWSAPTAALAEPPA